MRDPSGSRSRQERLRAGHDGCNGGDRCRHFAGGCAGTAAHRGDRCPALRGGLTPTDSLGFPTTGAPAAPREPLLALVGRCSGMRQEPDGVVSLAAIPNRTTRPLRPHRPDRHPASPLLVRAHCPESAGSGTRKPPSPPRRTLILGGWQNRAFSDPLRGTEKTRFLAPCGAKSGGGGGAPPTTLILLRNQRRDRARPDRPRLHVPSGPRATGPGGGWPPSEPVIWLASL